MVLVSSESIILYVTFPAAFFRFTYTEFYLPFNFPVAQSHNSSYFQLTLVLIILNNLTPSANFHAFLLSLLYIIYEYFEQHRLQHMSLMSSTA